MLVVLRKLIFFFGKLSVVLISICSVIMLLMSVWICCENVLLSECLVECVVVLVFVLIRLVMVLVCVRLSLLFRNVCCVNLFGFVSCSLKLCFVFR